MDIYNKIKWVLAILMVFILILATNLIDKKNFNSISDSITTIYEDRLVVKKIIFNISTDIHKKEVAFLLKDSTFFEGKNAKINENIEKGILEFGETRLTGEEKADFNRLKNNIALLRESENVLIESNFTDNQSFAKNIRDIKDNLNTLSNIQIEEGRKHFVLSQKTIGVIELFTQIEIYFLIFLAILAQIIILYKPKEI